MAENKRKSMRSQVLDIIKCSICLEIPDQPKVLPCMHLYCLACLESSIQYNPRFIRSRVQCAECRKWHNLPPGGVQNFATDYRAVQLGDAIHSLPTSPPYNAGAVASTTTSTRARQQLTRGISMDDVTKEKIAAKLMILLNEEKFGETRSIISDYCKFDRTNIVSAVIEDKSIMHSVIECNAIELLTYILDDCCPDVEQLTKFTDKETGDTNFVTLLWVALESGNRDAAEILVQRGADVNGTTDTGSSPLRVACYNNDTRMVEYLIQQGADVNICNQAGNSCLMVSAYNDASGHICGILLRAGAKVSAQNESGWTALHFAAASGNVSAAKHLLDHGADVHIKENILEQTAMDVAISNNDTQLVGFLKSNGAN